MTLIRIAPEATKQLLSIPFVRNIIPPDFLAGESSIDWAQIGENVMNWAKSGLFGSITQVTSLFGAIGARLLRNTPWLMPLPTLILNILVVPQILKYGYGVPLPIPLSMLYIGIGAFIACYVLGMLLFSVLKQIAPYLEDRTVRAR
jgi:hypothetical protein